MLQDDRTPLDWLTDWYASHCNGEWEHSSGIELATLDNPGWLLRVDLRATVLEDRPFEQVEHGHPASDIVEWRETGSWWVIEIRDGKFVAACGPLDLDQVLCIFRAWAESNVS